MSLARRLLAAPPPEGVPPDRNLAAGDDGSIWLWAPMREPIFVQGWVDGRWTPREWPGGWLEDLRVDSSGRVWVAGLQGFAAVREPGGEWHGLDGMPAAGVGHDLNLWRVCPDDQGGAWFVGHQRLIRYRPRGVEAFELGQPGTAWVEVDDRGALVVGGVRRSVFEDDGSVHNGPLFEASLSPARGNPGWMCGRKGCRFDDGPAWCASPDLSLVRNADICASSQGRLVLVRGDGSLWEAREGSAPVFRPTDESWGLDAVSDERTAIAADVDGDGLDDLVVSAGLGRSRILLQGKGTFREIWRGEQDLDIVGLEACDLDGSGRKAVLIQTCRQSAGRLDTLYLRPLDGWVEDVTEDIALHSRDGCSTLDSPPITCVDVDGDGDRDILIGGTAAPDGGPLGLTLYTNTGFGRLRPEPLPARGLGASDQWTRQALGGDLDRDGDIDFVLLNQWGDGYAVLEGRRDGSVVQRLGTGLEGSWSHATKGWLASIDGDDLLDVVAAEPAGRLPRLAEPRRAALRGGFGGVGPRRAPALAGGRGQPAPVPAARLRRPGRRRPEGHLRVRRGPLPSAGGSRRRWLRRAHGGAADGHLRRARRRRARPGRRRRSGPAAHQEGRGSPAGVPLPGR